MLNRWIGILCVLFMLSANTALFMRDVLPGWLAGDPPGLDDLTRGGVPPREVQTGIFDARGRVVGRTWTISRVQRHILDSDSQTIQGQILDIQSRTMLYPIMLPNGMATPQVRIETRLRYRSEDGLLDELVMSIRGLPAGVVLRGEMISDEFACSCKVGPRLERSFRLDAEATRALGDVIRPFRRLPGLYVGRTWRLQLLDPLSRVMPGLQTNDIIAEPQLVRVTRTEQIQHRGRPVETFVVEAHRMRAWVAPGGHVLRQEVELPLLGKLILVDEPFDQDEYRRAGQWSAGADKGSGPFSAADTLPVGPSCAEGKGPDPFSGS